MNVADRPAVCGIPSKCPDGSDEEFRTCQRIEAEAAAKAASREQAGFDVDVDVDASGAVTCPATIDAFGIGEDLERAAQVVEMLLIRDHSRLKFNPDVPYDSTQEQQFRPLSISHPSDFAAAVQAAGSPQDDAIASAFDSDGVEG